MASADEELGLAYFPMGYRTPDQLGMYRTPEEEVYSSSVVALSLETGQVEWVQQFVQHDLWDMDTPAQPGLVDIETAQGLQPALVVPTKQGDVNGTVEDIAPVPIPLELGVPGIGGPIITRGGVVFLAATVDDYLRAYNLTDGEELWRVRLPAGGQATPMTYLNSQGEQIVVQVAGGHGSIGTTIGEYVLAYKLK
nr:hypothetical protein [Marinobacter changyiensis]